MHLVGYEVLKVLLLFWYVIFNLFFYSIFLKVCVCKYVMLNSFTILQGEDSDDGDIETVELPSSVVESNH